MPAPTAATVSAVVLNWDCAAMVERCVASVLAQSAPPDELVVVDNGSRDGSADAVQARFPQVRLLRLGRNTGYAGGMNAGIAATTGDLVLLLNLDVELEPD